MINVAAETSVSAIIKEGSFAGSMKYPPVSDYLTFMDPGFMLIICNKMSDAVPPRYSKSTELWRFTG